MVVVLFPAPVPLIPYAPHTPCSPCIPYAPHTPMPLTPRNYSIGQDVLNHRRGGGADLGWFPGQPPYPKLAQPLAE